MIVTSFDATTNSTVHAVHLLKFRLVAALTLQALQASPFTIMCVIYSASLATVIHKPREQVRPVVLVRES